MTKTKFLKRSKNNKWTIPSLVALVIVMGGVGYHFYNNSQSVNQTENVAVTSTIGTGDIVLTATGSGKLVPSQEISFGFNHPGKVSEVFVGLGDKVQAGQVLARQENTTLILEYKRAEASFAALSSPSALAAADQALQDALAVFAPAKDRLQLLIGPDLLNAEGNLLKANAEEQRAKTAAEKNASNENKQKLTLAETALSKAQENLAQAQRNYEGKYLLQTFTYPVRNANGVTTSRELFAPSDTQVATARAAYEIAKANLYDAQNYLDILSGKLTTDEVPASSITSITEAKIALDQAKADLDATTLTAPITGTIISIGLIAGDTVASSAVITISNSTQPYTIDANLDETDWDKAKVGFDATVTFDLLPNNTYPAKIVQVYPVLDSSSGTSLVHILVQINSNIKVEIPTGATASVDVTGGKALGAVIVPISALKEVNPGKYIVYLMKNGKPVEQEIKIGLQDIINAEVVAGLQTGDVVLTNAPTN